MSSATRQTVGNRLKRELIRSLKARERKSRSVIGEPGLGVDVLIAVYPISVMQTCGGVDQIHLVAGQSTLVRQESNFLPNRYVP